MIRKYILLLSLALAGLSTYSFEWDGSIKCLPEDDEVLYFEIQNPWKPGFDQLIVYCLHGEKEIDVKTYRVLYSGNSIFNIAENRKKAFAYMREEDGKVYSRIVMYSNKGEEPSIEEECLLYDFSLQPGESYQYRGMASLGFRLEGDESIVRIIDVEVKDIYGKKRIVQKVGYPEGSEFASKEEKEIVSGIGYIQDGDISWPFQDRGPQLMSDLIWYTKPWFHGIYDFAGKRHDREQRWIERTEGEREYLPMLKSGRVWEYANKIGQKAYYRLKDAESLYGVEYYPVYRSEGENFAEETLVGYLRENCGQVFLRLTGYGDLPATERKFINIGEETILYDLNLHEGDKMILSVEAETPAYQYDYIVEKSVDVSYPGDPYARRYIGTTSFGYLEGIGPVNNGTLIYPLVEGAAFYAKDNEKFQLKRMWDDGELVFDGSRFSGVEAIATETDGKAEYFTLQGIRTDAKAPGIYLRRQGNKTEKIVVR